MTPRLRSLLVPLSASFLVALVLTAFSVVAVVAFGITRGVDVDLPGMVTVTTTASSFGFETGDWLPLAVPGFAILVFPLCWAAHRWLLEPSTVGGTTSSE